MAHELDKVVAFFKKFGDDVFVAFDNTKHNMKDYAEIVKRALPKEKPAEPVKQEVKKDVVQEAPK